MRIHCQRYQAGSTPKMPCAHGFAWEFRSHYTDTDGRRKLEVADHRRRGLEDEAETRRGMAEEQAGFRLSHLRRGEQNFGYS
jgi:hypothetical protein